MFQRIKKSYARNKSHAIKMTPITKVAVWTMFGSIVLWSPFYAWDLANWFMGQFDNGVVWIPYIMLIFATVVHIQKGRANLAFAVALASAPVQLVLGFYQDWYTIFTIDPLSVLEQAQGGVVPFFVLFLYLSNVLHLLGIVLLIAGRKEWMAKVSQ